MNNYFFRKVESRDLESIWSLIELLKSEGSDMSYTELEHKEELLNFIDNPAQLTFVAAPEKDPFRILCLVKGRREVTNEKSHAVFLSAATHPEARGFGLAAELTNYALEQMKNDGVNIARIYVYSDNKPSLNAVKKLGFVHSGTVLRHHWDEKAGGYVDDLIFHKLL